MFFDLFEMNVCPYLFVDSPAFCYIHGLRANCELHQLQLLCFVQLVERERRRRRLKFSRKRKRNLKQRFVVAPSVPVLLHLLVQLILQVKANPRELILVKVARNGSKKVVQKAVKEKQVETTWRQRNLIKETIL